MVSASGGSLTGQHALVTGGGSGIGLVDTEIAQGLFGTEVVLEDYLACMPLGRTGVVEGVTLGRFDSLK